MQHPTRSANRSAADCGEAPPESWSGDWRYAVKASRTSSDLLIRRRLASCVSFASRASVSLREMMAMPQTLIKSLQQYLLTGGIRVDNLPGSEGIYSSGTPMAMPSGLPARIWRLPFPIFRTLQTRSGQGSQDRIKPPLPSSVSGC